MASYDILGNIAIIKGENKSRKDKLTEAKKLLKIPSVEGVFEKIGNVKGRLRTINVKHIAGKKNLIATHCENGCLFRFDITTCYFSPRLSNERKEIAKKVKKKDKVLVMFAGVGVYPIVIYKIKKPDKIVGVEIGKDCCKYFKENLKLNKMKGIEVIQGDVKKKVNKNLGKFDVIIMARPNLKDSFFEQGLSVCKKNGRIFYYGFCNIDEKKDMIENLKREAKELKKKIKILRVIKAGEIAPYKFRYRIEIKVL
jgi:tRNA (guanine37-N1)-methyltransferase